MEPEYKQEFFIQPWTSPSEFMNCYNEIFQSTPNQLQLPLDEYVSSLLTSNLINGLKKLLIWQSRNDNKAFTLSSFLLLDSIIKIKNDEYNNSIDVCHILSEKIIRVTNLIVDELKKTKKTSNANMFLVAKDIDLPECIIETRHACTHKNLPHYNTLIFTIKFLFLWVKQKMWDKQYDIYIQEQQYYESIVSYLNKCNSNSNSNSKTNKCSFKALNNDIHLEINHLMEIIVLLFKMIQSKLHFDKNKLTLIDNIDVAITIYKQIQLTESGFSLLMVFLFISQQMLLIIRENISKRDIRKYSKEIQQLEFFAKFSTKYYTSIKKFNYKGNKTLMEGIYINLYQAVQYSNAFTDILNSYLFILKGYQFDPSIIDINANLTDIYLYQIGDIPIDYNDQIVNNTSLKPESNDNTRDNEDIIMKTDYNESDFIQEHYNTLIL